MVNYLVLKPWRTAGMTKEQEFCHQLPQAKIQSKSEQTWDPIAILTIGFLGVVRVICGDILFVLYK